MSDRFYVNQELGPGIVILHGPEAHHLSSVCRIRTGDRITLFNGDGRECLAEVVEVTRRTVTVEAISIEAPSRELSFSLHVAAALPKGDRAQFLVEKLTELGVQKLTILSSERSVIEPREAKMEKLRRYVIEASKQCGRNTLMQIEGPREFNSLIRDESLPKYRLLAHPSGQDQWPSEGSAVVVMIGPEGGFTDTEVQEAGTVGWTLVNLGPRILRLETAAIAVASRLALTSDQVGDSTLP